MMPLNPERRPERLSHAPALCLARWLVLGWTWAYTMAVPAEQRTTRRAEVLSDLHDQIEQERVREIAPSKTALHMMARLVLGIWDDLGWLVPFVPASLSGYLARSGEVMNRIRLHPLGIPSLATLGVMHLWLATGLDHQWFNWPLASGGVLLVALILLNRQSAWARLLSRLWSACMVALAIGTVIWFMSGVGADRMPVGYQLLLDLSLTVSLIVLGILAAARICGMRIFWAEWWPVWLGWLATALVFSGTTASASGGLNGFWGLSAVMVLACTGWMVLAATFAFASKGVCDAGLAGYAQSMRWLALGFRRNG